MSEQPEKEQRLRQVAVCQNRGLQAFFPSFSTAASYPARRKGWGYPRYTVNILGPMAGTRLDVQPYTPMAQRFVTLAGEPLLIRYNSKLPVVA